MLDKCKEFTKETVKIGADDAEVCILERRGLEYTLEKNTIKLVSTVNSVGLGLRVVKNHRLGFSHSTDMERIEGPAKTALSISRLGKEMKGFSFPSAGKVPKVQKVFDKRIASLPSDYGLEACADAIAGALEVDKEVNVTGGRIRYGVDTLSIANSSGLEAEDRVTFLFAEANSVLKKKGVSTGTENYSSRFMDADFSEIGKRSAQWAVDSSNPKKMKGGKMTVLFHPLALRSMLEFILVPGLYADRARKGESAYSDKIGEDVADKKISFYDDPRMPNGPNSGAIDDEGTPSSRTNLITKGRLESYLYDGLTASEYEEKSTSSAMRAGRLSNDREFNHPPKISARNFVLEGPKKAKDSLIAETENGILVHSVLGAHTSNPASGDFSVSSPRLLRIKDGEITHPVSSAMISGNLPRLLTRISGVGDDRRSMKGAIGALAFVASTARFDDVLVTG
jgi:PmbA protein